MAIEMNRIGTSVVPDIDTKSTTNTQTSNASDGSKSVSRDQIPDRRQSDQVSITPSAAKLQAVEQKLAALPVVDQARVDKLRSAVESGEYQIDTQRIAEKFIHFETELYK